MKWIDFEQFLQKMHLNHHQAIVYNDFLIGIVYIIAAILGFYLTRFVISRILYKLILKSRNDYDDAIVKNKVFEVIAHIVPAFFFYWGVKAIFSGRVLELYLTKAVYLYLIVASIILIFRLLNAFNQMYEIYAQKKKITVHIKQFIEVLKVILMIVAIVISISIIFNTKPGAFLTGLGALTAVLTLVFKDAILSFVASIQISAYKLINIGDWITIPSKSVDGDVIDVSLSSIKLRNPDNSISSVPTYLFVQEPFVNWRGMEQSGGRRIKRSLNFNVNSIKMIDIDLLNRFKNFDYISDFVNDKLNELHSKFQNNITSTQINLTNLSLFRIYIESYINANLRSFKTFRKQLFIVNDKKAEKFTVDNPDELKEMLGKDLNQYLETIEDKTSINNVDKFLMQFKDYFLLENDCIYFIRKFSLLVPVNGIEVEVEQTEKILEKQGMFCDDLRIIVRQLQPGDSGIPLEIYAFAATTNFEEYENIQSQLFEHLYAIIPEFELKLFQRSSS